ncbi:MAG: DUF1501 domain-containing protein [Ardenticatenaceae bacterium]|nr:DUF1501 domain-containing protein [Ardenticatenaceae bacterium]
MIKTTRRGFMVGCSAAIAGMAGARMNFAAFGSAEAEPNQEILVVVFLRGGWDVLNVVTPRVGHPDRIHYEEKRPDLRLPDNSLLPLGSHAFGLHPSATGLHELYNAGKLSIVQATGMHSNTRSHFDAMAYMELGTPDSRSSSTGWITRHMQTATSLPEEMLFPAMSAGNLQSQSLLGYHEAVAMSSVSRFNLRTGPWGWHDEHDLSLQNIYGAGTPGTSPITDAGMAAVDAMKYVDDATGGSSSYNPSGGAEYPSGSFGNNLKLIAQMIKLQLGLRVATIDLGGWDTHDNQAYSNGTQGHFPNLLRTLSDGMRAFYTDLSGCNSNYDRRTTLVVMSEFGRRLRENDQRGTDHGHGGMMLAMGGTINGGLYGQWPGLHTDQLYDQADLAVTTDYRTVLSELLVNRLENNNLSQVFPSYTGHTPMGIFNPVNPAVDYAIACNNRTYLPSVLK